MSFDISVPKGWQLVKLSDLGEVNRGKSKHRPRDADFLYGGKYPFIQTGDVKASNGRINSFNQTYSNEGLKQSRLWPVDTMCITIAANIAETGVLQFSACFPDSVIGFIADKTKCDVYFIEYMFRLLKAKIKVQANGSVQDNINLQTLERIHFPIPDLVTQKKIAQALGVLDDKIVQNNQMNQTLEQMAQALFKSWFVDFEPVKAKIAVLEAGGSQEDATLAAMTAISGKDADALAIFEREQPEQYAELKATAELFPSAMLESELGAVPEGWMSASLGSILEPKKGKNITKKTIEEGDVPVVAGGLAPAYYHSKCNVTGPVITISASGANAGFVNLYHCDIWASDCSYINKTQTHFVYCFYTFLKIKQEEITHMQQGAAQPHVYPKDLMRLGIVVPTMALWKRLEEILNSTYGQIGVHLNQNMYLESLRDTLLPKLLSGEITLPEAERAVSEAENV
ncbi:restriction endonuclease subunit S [Enterobacter asburiae]|uniref:restriction endonuclease subunit S n=1 Tax=Enterobacter asburiae TaxID=61645 RepID=UPI002148024E|nr:restriction endonuclease subunit S [Enterobacter asburiae]UUR71800.1 restriction endonuclease subunit S [Enterobacter asburiae]